MTSEADRRRFWPVAAISLLVFALAGLLGGPGSSADTGLIHWLAAERAVHPGLGVFAIGLTQLGGAPGMVAILGVALAAWVTARQWRAAVSLALIVLGGRIAVELLKLAIDRPRPHFEPYPVHVASLSFPSGHAANSMMTFLAMALIAPPEKHRREMIAAAVLGSLAIGSTRPFLGVHWPSDVIGGWAFAIAWVIAGIELSSRWRAAAK
jgi:undecaprenyl-diphosphatase